MPQSQPNTTHLRALEHVKVGIWRHGLMPLIVALRGSSASNGRVTERRYGARSLETMDVVAPSLGTSRRAAVVFVHGGGWIAGSKGRFYHRPLLELADAGHPVFSLNYPLAPEAPHPQALRSLLSALELLRREHAVEAVHLVGDSAGGNLAAMLGLMLANADLLRSVDNIDRGPLPRVLSTVSLYGVLDRTSWLDDGFPSARLFVKAYAGEQALDAAYSPPIPITPMDARSATNIPPTFLGVGSKDKLARSSRLYAEHLTSVGAQVTCKTYEGADHGFYCFAEPQGQALRADVIGFLAKVEAAAPELNRSTT
jgi:acetyl esterase/lipase